MNYGRNKMNNVMLLFFFSEEFNEAFRQSMLKELQEERAEKVCISFSADLVDFLE